ncbi:hypothetical protein [Hoyosella altamirensis]|uniref:Restriction endonuclease n=1 Tax=Hoyosella altamirensis TaxID=616997 RepID=A0A839RKG2_9ACTN|nr:hypothetical protein [Hoyosella altamirensis]MBB3036606.1 hypothetical protein [Hoyosella altamirensis]
MTELSAELPQVQGFIIENERMEQASKNGKLPRITVIPKTGSEPITIEGSSIGATVSDFWSWSCSDLVSNRLRGVLAEYIVGLALGCVTDQVRTEWDAADLRLPDGTLIEVKSAAYIQSWQQTQHSAVSFNISPTTGWDATTNTVSEERKRQADVYVFCLLKHRDKQTVNPLEVNQWDFYVMPTEQINERLGEQRTVSLSRLLSLNPATASFATLPETLHHVMHGRDDPTLDT